MLLAQTEVRDAYQIVFNDIMRWVEGFFGFDLIQDPNASIYLFLLRFLTSSTPLVIFFVLCFSAAVRIIRRAGFSRLWIIPMMIPLLNVVLFLGFSVTPWPLERKLRNARAINETRARMAREEEITSGRFLYAEPGKYKLPEELPPSRTEG